MAIGVTRVHGGVGVEGVINGESGTQLGGSLAFFLITAKDGSNSAVDLRGEMAANPDGGLGGAVEAILRTCPQGVLAYNVANANTGVISIVVDGVNAPQAAELQTTLRALGTTVGSNSLDLSGTTVIRGGTFTVAA